MDEDKNSNNEEEQLLNTSLSVAQKQQLHYQNVSALFYYYQIYMRLQNEFEAQRKFFFEFLSY